MGLDIWVTKEIIIGDHGPEIRFAHSFSFVLFNHGAIHMQSQGKNVAKMSLVLSRSDNS